MRRLCLSLAVQSGFVAAGGVLVAAPIDEQAKEQPKPVPLEDVMVPIPGYSPPVTDNGCSVRRGPTLATASRRSIPFWELISDHVGRYAVEVIVSKGDPRAAYAKAIAGLDPDTRTLTTLYALWDGLGRDGLHTFFYMRGGTIAYEVRDALKAAGLTHEFEIFSRAMALFGPDYPVDDQKRETYFEYSKGNGELNAFDNRLLALAKSFPDKPALARAIEAFVITRPALWTTIEARRKTLGSARRLQILTSLLLGEYPPDVPDERVGEALGKFTPEERTLMALDIFNSEFEDGGVHQFFFNSTGAFAPEIYDAFIAAGMKRQADILKRGMDMFRAPFPRTRETRSNAYIGRKDDEGFETGLSDLTDDFYALDGGADVTHIGGSTQISGGPGIRDGMLRFAIEHKMLPC